MTDRADASGGFTVLDGLALVTGAAVASVHVRSAVAEFDSPAEWAWACCLFTWLSITSAGPFVYLVRRFFTRPGGYPKLGDRLWAMTGSPWLLAAIVRTGEPQGDRPGGRLDPAYVGSLSISLALVALVAVPLLAYRFLRDDPSRPKLRGDRSWTDRIGLTLTVAWPIQCGLGLIVMS